MFVATYPARVDARVNLDISRWLSRAYWPLARGIFPVGPTVALAETPPPPRRAGPNLNRRSRCRRLRSPPPPHPRREPRRPQRRSLRLLRRSHPPSSPAPPT